MIRVFLVEDEAPARRKLRRMVLDCAGTVVCGEAGSYQDAVAALEQTDADVVLLDVELGDGTGFEVLQSIGREPGFAVIFCTAYDEYALKAFGVAAIDYLVKPIEVERLREALSRVKPSGTPTYSQRLLVEHRRAMHFLAVESIDWIEADRNYLVLHAGAEEYVLRGTMESMARRLDPADFARASRGAIVRVGAIARVKRDASGEWEAVLASGNRVGWSRKYWSAAIQKFL